jgi:hypothetical protein
MRNEPSTGGPNAHVQGLTLDTASSAMAIVPDA